MITAVVTGLPEIDAKLKRMYLKDANRIARAMLRTGSERAAQNIRAAIPASIAPKAADKGIGASTKRGTAKAGIGVGNSQKYAPPVTRKRNRRGVGVSARNLHWFAIGTMDRYTGSVRVRGKGAPKGARKATGGQRRYTGRLDKFKFGQFVKLHSNPGDVQLAMYGTFQKLYEKMATTGVEP